MKIKHHFPIALFLWAGTTASFSSGSPAAAGEDMALADTMVASDTLASAASAGDMFSEATLTPGPTSESSGESYAVETEETSWVRDFLITPAKISSQYEFAYNMISPSGIRNNRNSLRIEYSKFFLEHFYLGLDAKVSAYWPRDHRTRSTTVWINDEPSEEEISLGALAREAYLQATVGALSLKAGVQVPAWGEFEFISVTDELSPQDFREPLVVSLEELRLGQPMIILDQYSKLGNVSAFLVPYPLFNEHPRQGTSYYFDPFMGMPVSDWDRDPWEMEYGLRWKRNFDNTDISLVAARMLANEHYYSMPQPGRIEKGIQPYYLAGGSLNYALKQTLLKAEVAAKLPRAFMDETMAKAEKHVLDAALGLTYNWNATTSVTVEAANSHVLEWSGRLQGVPRNAHTVVGMLRKQLFNDDLSLAWISIYNGPYRSYFHTLSASYLWSDWITVSGEILWPDPDDPRSPAWSLREQKQAAFRIKHQF